ncbi:MAG: TolC family protein [Halanaerobiaceae bacterium]|nr:TolC family protein [Halanaerobiaceae bacterium]
MKIQISKRTLFLALIISLLILPGICPVSAEEVISLEEAIRLGMENNKGINEARDGIANLEKALEKIEIQADWKLNLGADYTYTITDQDKAGNFGDKNKDDSSWGLRISASKNYLSGLTLAPVIGIDEDTETDFTLRVSKDLYPVIPTASMRNYWNTEISLNKARENLRELKINNILDWLESYSNIKRMISRQDIYTENLNKAESNMEKVLRRQKIGDAGRNEILAAELGLKNAEYSLKEAGNQLENALYNFASSIGFSGEKIIITDKNNFFDRLMQAASDYSEELLSRDMDELYVLIEKNNYKLRSNLLDREVMERELEWLKKENHPELSFEGMYNSSSDNLFLSLKLSYQLYDGGQHKMEIEEKEKEIKDNIDAYDELYNELKQELKQLLDRLELAEMALERGYLSLERSRYELTVAEQQLEMGVIDYLEYQDKWVSEAEAEIQIAVLKEQLFLDRMRFIKFLDLDLAYEIIGGF